MNNKLWKRPLLISFVVWGAVVATSTFYIFNSQALYFSLGAYILMAFGFKVTEMLVALFTGMVKANTSGVALVFSLKICWWGLIVIAAQYIAPSQTFYIATGIGGFLLAILSTVIFAQGLPKFYSADKAES
jgi:hypothetical protein